MCVTEILLLDNSVCNTEQSEHVFSKSQKSEGGVRV